MFYQTPVTIIWLQCAKLCLDDIETEYACISINIGLKVISYLLSDKICLKTAKLETIVQKY